MPKNSSVYICQKCDRQVAKWSGQCSGCGEWNSLVETVVSARPSGFGGGRRISTSVTRTGVKPLNLKKVASRKVERVSTGIGELDRVLGGGIVPGSVTLVAGAPGIGKSSLLTKVVSEMKGLYILGEESAQQVKLRVERMGLSNDFDVLSETQSELIVGAINKQPLVVIDSIQTMWTDQLKGVAGSVGQIRESSQMFLQKAKESDVPIFLVGHVTKEGAVAGPKVLEHLVDTVLQFEGDGKHEYRLLRAVKNRFGPTDEVGVFAMQENGLNEVSNPTELFLQNYDGKQPPGSVVVCTMQGVRPVLVEIQALVNYSTLAMPRRIATGIDQRRLQVLCAVVERHAGIKLSERDVFVNVAGGMSLKDPAADLGICMSIAASSKNKSLSNKTVVIGEVGLLGEIRKVSFLDKREKESKAQGYKSILSGREVKGIREAVARLR